MSFLKSIHKIGCSILKSGHFLNNGPNKTLQLGSVVTRACSSYDAYPKMEDTPDPFHPKIKRRYGNTYKLYSGGPLPRPKGDYEDKPVGGYDNQIDFSKRDQWSSKKALFGQNDYIDILGDGSVHPYQLMQGPKWLRGFKGNELQRLVRRMKYEGRMLQDLYPQKYHELRKQIFFLYKRLNTRREAPFWSGNNPWRGSRFRRANRERFKGH